MNFEGKCDISNAAIDGVHKRQSQIIAGQGNRFLWNLIHMLIYDHPTFSVGAIRQ